MVPGRHHLHLEPIGGMAGDMFLGALIDLGVPEVVVAEAVGALGLGEVTVETRRARRGGVDGVRFRVLVGGVPLEGSDPGEAVSGTVDLEASPDPSLDLDLTLDGVLDLLAASPLAPPVRRRAERMFGRLAEALGRAGGRRPPEVRFTGRPGIDFLADVVGSAAAIVWLAPERITCGPVHVGGPAGAAAGDGGSADPSRAAATIGLRTGPAPGSLRLLGDAPILTSGGGERLTPTGAVLLAELVDEFVSPPPMEVEARGFGLGRAETPDCPNVVEALVGLPGTARRNKSTAAGRSIPGRNDRMTTSEAIDDTGQRASAEGSLEMGLAGGGWLRYGMADLGEVVEEARDRLDLSPIASAALGRAMSASVLLLRMSLKMPSRLVLEVKGDGPLGSVLAETDAEGHLRGTVGNPRVDLASRTRGKLPVGEAVGAGTLRVVREHPKGSYASQVELVSGEIGIDVAHFLHQSEQTRSAVMLGVLTRPAGVTGAGGLIVELLPGAPEELVTDLEANLQGLGGVSRLLEEGGGEQVLDTVLAGMDREVLERRGLVHRCRCDRERLLRHLAVLSEEERRTVLTDEGVVEGDCVFCGVRYVFTPEELDAAAEDEVPA